MPITTARLAALCTAAEAFAQSQGRMESALRSGAESALATGHTALAEALLTELSLALVPQGAAIAIALERQWLTKAAPRNFQDRLRKAQARGAPTDSDGFVLRQEPIQPRRKRISAPDGTAAPDGVERDDETSAEDPQIGDYL